MDPPPEIPPFISRIYSSCVLALMIVGVGMSTKAQSTHVEIHKREKPHLFAVGNRHSINIEVGTGRFIGLE